MILSKSKSVDYDTAIFLAKVCIQAYNQFDNPSQFAIPQGYQPIKNIEAKALGKTELFGFIIESPEDIVVAFRGTDSDSDIIADLEFLQVLFFLVPDAGKTHAGFTFIYFTCHNQLIDTLHELPADKTLYITGHSLGAALATLNALDVSANTDFKQIVMCNFASPRVGNPDFVGKYNSRLTNSVRFVNVYDVIPMLPPEKFTIPFTQRVIYNMHVQKEFPFAVQTGSLRGNHSLQTYLNALKTEIGVNELPSNVTPTNP